MSAEPVWPGAGRLGSAGRRRRPAADRDWRTDEPRLPVPGAAYEPARVGAERWADGPVHRDRANWPVDESTTGEWIVDPLPAAGSDSGFGPVTDPTMTGELTGEWPTGEWTRAGRAPRGWEPSPPTAPTAADALPIDVPEPPAGVPRLLATARPDGRPVTLDEHVRGLGELSPLGQMGALRLVEESGLGGRGGAGFPVAAKMRAVLAGRGRALVLVNGAAGDPLSEKDAFLLARLPHLVLDGAQFAAEIVAARQVVVYAVERPGVFTTVERALAERRQERHDVVPVKLVPASDRYLAGESSAAASAAGGGPGLPTFQPPHTAERGIKGRPTLVQNVETFANLGLLARYGADWFRTVGTADEPGSMLVTVRGAVRQPAVIEAPVGTPVEQALLGAGGAAEPLGAVLVGGSAGRWLPAAVGLPAPLSRAGLAAVGGTLGVGSVFALPESACGLAETARLVRFLADESSGQCGACLNGLPAIAGALAALADGQGDASTVQRLYRWCGMVTGRGACHHPDGTAGLVASALQVFGEDVHRHLGGWCGRPARGVLPVPAGPRTRRREAR